MQDSFSLTTYNILAQAYADPDRYAGVAEAALEPVARRSRILDRLLRLNTDVFCLQEVEPEMAEAIADALPDHTMHYEKNRDRPDGVASLFAKTRFRCRDVRPIHFRAVESGPDQQGLILLLDRGDRPLVVANIHLRWQSSDTPRHQHQGLDQFRDLLEALPDGPCVIAGDFNEDSDGPVLEEARRMGLRMSAPLGETALVNGIPRRLDYVLHTASTFLPSPRPMPALSGDRPIPSTDEPSDHVPLTVDIGWVST